MTGQNQAEIVSIGTELLMGETLDTNASYLATQLPLFGIRLGRVTVVGDERAELCHVLGQAIRRAGLVIATGGLGPTDDDLTRECIADVLGEKLTIASELEQDIQAFFRRLGRDMPPTNLRQAMLIPSATALRNPLGTAPGWWVERNGKVIVALPGPPREMQPMWQKDVVPRLRVRFPGEATITRTIKTFGLSEAKVNEMVMPFFHADNPRLGIYAKLDGIHLRLIASGQNARSLLEDTAGKMAAILDNQVWGYDNDTLPAIAGRLLSMRSLSLATMEDGTQGVLAAMLAGAEGAACHYRGSLMACSDEMKVSKGVSAEVLKRSGPVSSEVAEEMALAARREFSADIGLSVTGITGLGYEGPVPGVAYIGMADAHSRTSRKFTTLPYPDVARERAAIAALFHLRQRLMESA
ncbi:MAG: CinA family nicotinamide mononucleotide deamidase-related protein [Chloroflexi bacterium]|nr:CinA family nicotinamide mononucleotide deamidase-related protein [Chloroflexota bacterium]